jgi:hypothetical protein
LGFAVSFCFGSGSTRSGRGDPTRARAFAFTAFTTENVRFFDPFIASLTPPGDYAILSSA